MIDASRFKRSFPAHSFPWNTLASFFMCATRFDDTSRKPFYSFQKKERKRTKKMRASLANLWLARTVIKLSIWQAAISSIHLISIYSPKKCLSIQLSICRVLYRLIWFFVFLSRVFLCVRVLVLAIVLVIKSHKSIWIMKWRIMDTTERLCSCMWVCVLDVRVCDR